MKFLCLAHLDRRMGPPADLTAQYAEMEKAMIDAGVFVATGRLGPPEESKTVRVSDGRTEVLDLSPSTGGSVPSAFFLLECADLDEALEWAARIPASVYGSIEVRPPR